MSEKKNIDRLFQEKFKDFEVQPPEMAWQNIESGLQKKKEQKKPVPLWFRLSGVAAILLLGLMLSIPIFNSSKESSFPVVIEGNGKNTKGVENKNITPMDKPIKPYQTVTDNGNETVVMNENGDAIATGNNGNNANSSADAENANPSDRNSRSKLNTRSSINAVAYDKQGANSLDNNKRESRSAHKGNTKFNSTDAEKAVAHQDKASGKKGRSKAAENSGVANENGNDFLNNTSSNQNAIADRESNKSNKSGKRSKVADNGNAITNNKIAADNAVADNRRANSKNQSGAGNKNSSANQQAVADNGDGNTGKQNQTAAQNNSSKNAGNNTLQPQGNTGVAANTKADENAGNATIDKSATENALAEATNDTVKPANELEDLLKKKLEGDKDKEEELLAQADAKKDKWNIKPQLAPLFYNSMSQGSPIDSQFAGNSKEYDNDLSYGVGINYALNDRISIRTGVNTVNLSYKTNDIQFYAALDRQTPNIIASASASANIVVQNADFAPPAPTEGIVADQLVAEKFSGSLVQKMGYIEVPLEMSYKLLNRRFGIDIIGGVSTLFLNDNNVSVVSTQGYRSDVGEAENLNNVHFSTNIGVGFKYRFWKSFEANFEPMFKYQVNTFSNNAGNFRPYFIGLYSGLSFSF